MNAAAPAGRSRGGSETADPFRTLKRGPDEAAKRLPLGAYPKIYKKKYIDSHGSGVNIRSSSFLSSEKSKL